MKCNEHICFAVEGHASVLAHPQLRERRLPFHRLQNLHMTGWKRRLLRCACGLQLPNTQSSPVRRFASSRRRNLMLADMLRAAGTLSRVTRFYRKKNAMCWLTRWRRRRAPVKVPLFSVNLITAQCRRQMTLSFVSANRRSRCRRYSAFCLLRRPFPASAIRLCFAKQESTLLAASACKPQLQPSTLWRIDGLQKLLQPLIHALRRRRTSSASIPNPADFALVPA